MTWHRVIYHMMQVNQAWRLSLDDPEMHIRSGAV